MSKNDKYHQNQRSAPLTTGTPTANVGQAELEAAAAAEAERVVAAAEAAAAAEAEALALATAAAATQEPVLKLRAVNYPLYDPYQKLRFGTGDHVETKLTSWVEAQLEAKLLTAD